MDKHLLLTPGPTIVPDELCEVLGRPIIHHRTSEFQAVLKDVMEDLKYLFQTKNDVYLLASSGTGAMEAAVTNLLSAGDKAITVQGGKFGERWTELCKAFGIEAHVMDVEWGKDVDPQAIKALLDKDPDIKAVFVTLCETSTGVTSDIEAIGKVVKDTSAVLVVDAVSGLGVTDCQTDNWNVDVVVSGSHKGMMLPPGVGMISVSDKAHKLVEQSTLPKYYFDLKKSKKAAEKIDTPFTPAINIIIGMQSSLALIKKKGLQNMFQEFGRLAKGMRAAAEALGLGLLADSSCISNTLTAIKLPDNVDGNKLVKEMRERYKISIAGGQGHLKGKIVRFAHMGCVTENDLLKGLECFEILLKELGHTFEAGAGVNAAKKIFESEQSFV